MRKIFILTIVLVSVNLHLFGQSTPKHRLVVLTDIEADPDDAQTLIRLLLYSNEIDIEAIIATTSVHQKSRVAPETIHEILDAYGRVQPNLLLHHKDFPEAAHLKSLVSKGLPVYGMEGVGDGKDSEGSELIIKILEKNDDRPVHVSVWGGPNTLAQALWKIRETRTKKEAEKLINKMMVYTISDQDDSGSWMRKEFPGLAYIVSPGSYANATWRAINQVVEGIDNTTISNEWLATNIQQGHGPLGSLYPDVAYGLEGDTPSWLNVIPNGLNNPEHPDWGGWGGRYELYTPEFQGNSDSRFTGGVPMEPETRPIWTNAEDTFSPRVFNQYGRAIRKDTVAFSDNFVTLWRWRDDFQNDFAARMDWTVKNFENANHPPVPALGHPDKFTVKSGEVFSLDASGTYDPDGDNLSYWWFQYKEVGSYQKDIDFRPYSENLYNVHTIEAPVVQKPETVHFILRVTDKGTPALSRYKRVIVTIVP
ncbi:nucleoside hydrolase-like domain-containing protein [Arthrospiribacter ruber]|uniref:DUF1593 domain-containing protein n=1 Tax=Arthrospiribacter ruber TaxID=2487934 RepID=A0A951IWW2_9BACT|nr:nucleoside hydrolase-like domain-containing protein [Arthrospiribacter ruber]MBW3467003.1 DUF1593 domain-containing protein [Arthrospiribacter ruber]